MDTVKLSENLPAADAVGIPFNVYSYSSSSELLLGYIEYKRRTMRYFSVSGWSKRLGLPTSGIIVNLLKKRRLPPEDLTLKFSQDMGLNAHETNYFVTLVAAERASHAKSLSLGLLHRRLESLRMEARTEIIGAEGCESLADLKTICVNEILSLRGVDATPSAIAQQSRVGLTSERTTEILDALVRTGMIERVGENAFRTLDHPVQSTNDIPSSAIRNYHRESLNYAVEALEKVPVEERHFSSFVMPVIGSRMAEAKSAIDRFIYDFASDFQQPVGAGDQVFQINVNFIPLSEKVSS